ncbi:MAG: DUF2207 domain-containing protein [Thermoanaerobaculia bacterium]|nr:DUF2207 domain-containing protein [Thermoanaerobaculia bacterium]
MLWRSRVHFALLVLSVCATASAQQRQLHWDELSVKARLDAEGRLRVEERQVMVFTGDWNGGERTFDIRPRQQLQFERMSRIDSATGVETPMKEGSLDEVDHYAFAGRNILRWRARSTSDPAFDNTKLTYVLNYTLSNVLLKEGEEYVLDHDFAFSKREGPIDQFKLALALDPVWQTKGVLQETWTADAIPPGKSFVLRVPLRFTGVSAPVADSGLGADAESMLLALAVVPLLLLGYALLREKMLGRLEPAASEISRGWVEQNLLRERPEVVGALWDGHVGSSEVSATLARMVGEKRLKSEVKNGDMSLEILTRKDLDEYEQALLDGLFFRGNHTSTEAIRTHYAASGFNPAEKMAPGLKKFSEGRLPPGDPAKPSGLVPTLLFIAAIAAFVYSVGQHRELLMKAVFIFFGSLFAGGLATLAPNFWRARKALGIGTALLSMIPAVLITAGVAFIIWRSASTGAPDLPREMQAAIALSGLWIFASAAGALRSRESREAIARIKMLGAARGYFRDELLKERPALDDSWYPYLLAFGLNKQVERWFSNFPGRSSSHNNDRWTSSSPSSGSSITGSGWTGGGGAFGGAGATGMWAAAASGMAAGVAAPSSSSGSSSSSSSGGSSGGGGGGGW